MDGSEWGHPPLAPFLAYGVLEVLQMQADDEPQLEAEGLVPRGQRAPSLGVAATASVAVAPANRVVAVDYWFAGPA
jgi:hypothetical protein